jgi:hypothetical protein
MLGAGTPADARPTTAEEEEEAAPVLLLLDL